MLNEYHIKTAHNVRITYQLASLGSRIAAYFIDYIILSAYTLLMIFMMVLLPGPADWAFDNQNVFGIIIFILVVFGPFIFYHAAMEYFFSGQSIGKRIMKIQVISEDNSPLTAYQILLRWLLRLVDFNISSGLVGLLSIVISDENKRLGDMTAGTLVIDLSSKKQNLSHILDKAEAEAEKEIKYPEAEKLTKKEAKIIENLLLSKSANKVKLASRLEQKLQEKYNVTPKDPVLKFLRDFLDDYYKLQ